MYTSSNKNYLNNNNQTKNWDVVGIGEAIIDFSACVNEQQLQGLRVEKGGRRVIDMEERSQVLESLGDGSCKINAGGAVSNTLVGISQLGRTISQMYGERWRPCKVAMVGRLGDDKLGLYFKNSMEDNGVKFLSPPQRDKATGTVVVLTTQDAQRTFLAFQGNSQLEISTQLLETVQSSKIVIIEGYLLDHPDSLPKIVTIIDQAKKSGILVALSGGDPGLVDRSRDAFNKIIEKGVDIFLANQAEAVSFLQLSNETKAEELASILGQRCSIAVVTDGSKGSHIYVQQDRKCYHIKSFWTSSPPVDTTGAGDAYAAGLLFGMMMGFKFDCCGELGSRLASAVIGQSGSRIKQEEVDQVFEKFVNDFKNIQDMLKSF
eukprot:TRINITY_DN1012_c0_g1_i4.p1 TRINITY_DN1012_c0_g1~~TRINITY_DN1012_c0_g1_i4.p1  ORF type:complete len:376 (-),score=53.47 TRINITY_DN1012_c0_g1_i4:343-1470(-)